MSEIINYSIGVDYTLYTIENGEKTLEEKTGEGNPFRFLSGFGTTLEAFEENIVPLNIGDTFDFIVTQDKAYGEYVEERVLELDKEMFCIEGKFDAENVYEDAIIPLQNADGQRFYGRVDAITADKVKVDLNHPLAGKDLNFVGKVVEKREATNKEIEAMVAHLTGGCHGGCGGCSGGNCGGDCGGDCGGNCGGDCNK